MTPIFNSRMEVENYYSMYDTAAQCYIRKDEYTLLIAKNQKQAFSIMEKLGW